MKNWLTKNKRALSILGTTLVVVAIVFGPQSAHAQAGSTILKSIAGTFLGSFLGPLGDLVLAVAMWVLGIAGYVLNHIIEFTVLKFASSSALPAVNTAWTVFRDLANMLFIFILIYIAIGTILRLSTVQTKKMLVHVIIVALLLNFSLFFTKIIIDTSNIVTIGFYGSVMGLPTSDSGKPSPTLAEQIQAKLGLSTVYGTKAVKGCEDLSKIECVVRLFITKSGGAVFTLILTFVLVAAGVLFLLRYVTLLFLMILAPLAYVAYIIPTMQKHSSDWWKKLIDNCIFPPAFMALLWVSIQLIPKFTVGSAGFDAMAGSVSGGKVAAPEGGVITIIYNFFLAIALLIGTIILSKKIGVAGADTVNKWGKSLRTGAQGFVGRNTIGRVGYAIDKQIGNTAFGNTAIGRGLRNITTKGAGDLKFGSKESYSGSVDKTEKLDKKYAEKQVENLDKKLDKELPQRRTQHIADQNIVLERKRKELAGAVEFAASDEEKNRIKNEIGALERDVQETTDLVSNNAVASQKEKDRWLRPMLKAKQAELEKPGFIVRAMQKTPLKGFVKGARDADLLKKGARQTTAELMRDEARGKKSGANKILEEIAKNYGTTTGGTPETPPATPPPPAPSSGGPSGGGGTTT